MRFATASRLVLGMASILAVLACNDDRSTNPAAVSPLHLPTRSTRTAVPLEPDSPFGIDFQGDHINDNGAAAAQAARVMGQGGVRFARITVYWPEMELGPSNGLDSQARWHVDTIVNSLIAAGIEPYITLEASACYAVSRYNDPNCGNFHTYPPDTPAHWQAWATYVQEMVQAYPLVHYWGVWNEPNSNSFLNPWTGNRLDSYRHLVELAAPIIRAAGGKVIGPDLGDADDDSTYPATSARDWLANFMASDSSLVDVVAVHYYGGGTALSYTGYMSDMASRAGGKDVWLTEVARGDWENGVNDSDQAINLATVYRAMLSGAVPQWKKTFYFNAGVFSIPDRPSANPGIVHDLGLESYAPRFAYDSLRAIAGPIEDPLSVYISGPTDANNSPSCNLQYFAHPSRAGDYSYQWQTDGTIVQDGGDWVQVAWGPMDMGHTVSVTISDGASTAHAAIDVQVSASGPDCNSY